MKTISWDVLIRSTPEKVFASLDDLGVTGMHMTQSSAMMMGSRLHLDYISVQHTGLGTRYRWTGRMMGLKMDFTVEVTKWTTGKEKVWETVGDAMMIIYSWYRMHLLVSPTGNGTHTHLSISYERPGKWVLRILSFLFADWYCNWCLKKMLRDAKRACEEV